MRASSRTTHLLSLFVLPVQSRLHDHVYVSRSTLVLGGEGRGEQGGLADSLGWVEFKIGVGLKEGEEALMKEN